jgi:hypothetical protein
LVDNFLCFTPVFETGVVHAAKSHFAQIDALSRSFLSQGGEGAYRIDSFCGSGRHFVLSSHQRIVGIIARRIQQTRFGVGIVTGFFSGGTATIPQGTRFNTLV